MDAADVRWMRLALGLAARRLGQVAPNPAVGAAIVKDGRLLGRGATAPGGRPHAEVIALQQATRLWGAEAIRGATAYVTLEPCAHHGKTPPCVDALIAAGIARVVCPIQDPDPRVHGKGFATLREAGVTVETGLLEDEATRTNAGFLKRQIEGRPWVTLKMAATLDGRIATQTGESRWITGAEARAHVHLMRARSDGVLVGAGTARVDDPMLDVRLPGSWPAPVRIIADGGLSLSLTSRLVATAVDQPVWVLHRHSAPAERAEALDLAGVTTIEVASIGNGQLEMADCLQKLGARGLTRILCEGGGRLAAALIREALVDEIVLFTAGKVIGGDGLPVVQGFGIEALKDAAGFELAETDRIGGDVVSRWLRPGG
ncbi:bifunctional diaminohydroxyphosphoribosylaminopyrimidine deaminase/5-amino-6-(5-phosphoribosylamino)uracil reductase RibD [Rhodobacteraceae bacterium NNCM2]|nr:bifunctional diaminohydroxyphosphoribosylaminopyrimidine deaminase/5-amino-6-(5-phosphoribosylamino)uracil reductase RibD [Coraliihabitans acroporae]